MARALPHNGGSRASVNLPLARVFGAEPLETFTLITTVANELAAEIHDRMPVILSQNDYNTWLDPKNDNPESLSYLFEPYPQ